MFTIIRKPMESSEDDCSLDLGDVGPNMSLPTSFSANGCGKYRPKLPCPAKQRMLQYRANHLSMSQNSHQRFEPASHSESKICSEFSDVSNTSSEQESSSQCLDDSKKDADQGTYTTRISIETGAYESPAQSNSSKLNDMPDSMTQSSQACNMDAVIGFDDYSDLTKYVTMVSFMLSMQTFLACVSCIFCLMSLKKTSNVFIIMVYLNNRIYTFLLLVTLFLYVMVIRKERIRKKFPKLSLLFFTIVLISFSVLMQLYFGNSHLLYLTTGMTASFLLFLASITYCCTINCTRPYGFFTNFVLFTVAFIVFGYFIKEWIWDVCLASFLSFIILYYLINNMEMVIFHNDNKFGLQPRHYCLGVMQAHFGCIELLLRSVNVPKISSKHKIENS